MPAAVEETTTTNNTTDATKNEPNENEMEQEDNKPDPDQQRWNVLKAHIMRDRARKKQEREQEVEEERLRKEREARAQQDVMTLGETREQISQLELKLQQFKEEKHQLFLQLKKVLNEDDNRRKQLQKETTEQHMVQLQSLQQGMVQHQPQTLYIQQSQAPGRIQTIGQQAPPSLPPAAYKTAVKRPRSPSPPIQVPVYHQGYQSYKPPSVPAGSYQGSPQKDDGRRNELVRAVLWNKAPQYTNQPSAFYPVGPQDIPVYYPGLPRDPAGRPVYDQQRPQGFQIDHKITAEHYSALRTAPSQHGHVIHPGPGLAINPGQATQPKGGSITAGYPVRSQPQYQQAAPASMYTTQSRQIFQNYPQRE